MKRIASILMCVASLRWGDVAACDGPDPGPIPDRYGNAQIVAIVRVTSLSIAAGTSYVEGNAEVLEVLKGSLASPVTVRGYVPSVDCWAPVDVGRDYVVFLQDPAGRHGHVAWFSLFGKSVPVRGVPTALLEMWRAGE